MLFRSIFFDMVVDLRNVTKVNITHLPTAFACRGDDLPTLAFLNASRVTSAERTHTRGNTVDEPVGHKTQGGIEAKWVSFRKGHPLPLCLSKILWSANLASISHSFDNVARMTHQTSLSVWFGSVRWGKARRALTVNCFACRLCASEQRNSGRHFLATMIFNHISTNLSLKN